MPQRGVGLSWTVGGKHERGPSVDDIGHLWSSGGQRDSVHVGSEVKNLDGQRWLLAW